MKRKTVIALFALALCSSSLWAGSATWIFRSGVGTSPENPTLWTDPDNWVGGSPASGETATATFSDGANQGTSSDVVWVKLPDDEYVDLCRISHTNCSNSAKFCFIGGKGFRFFRYSGSGADRQAVIEAKGNNAGKVDTYYSPITVAEDCLLNVVGCNLACPMTFGKTNDCQLYLYWPEARYRCEWYAPCGGETRSCIPALEYLKVGHLDSFGTPQNNDAHVGHWTASSGSKLLKYISGKKGTELAVGQYVHATGIIPEGAYVERIYTDDYIEISEPALGSSSDATVDFDRCYYKLTQRLKKYIAFGGDSQFGFVERKKAENTATLEIDELSNGGNANTKLQFFQLSDHYYAQTVQELEMENYPLPGVVVLPDMSSFENAVGGRSGWVRFSSTAPGGADIEKYLFYDSASYRQNGFYVFDTAEGISSTVSCSNEWYGSIGKRGYGELTIKTSIAEHKYLRVYEGLCTLDPSASGSTMTKVTVKAGGTFRLAPDRALTVSTLVVEAGGRISFAAGASLAPTTLTFAAGGIVRVEDGVTFDVSAWNLPDGTVFEGPGAVTGLTNEKVKACVFRDGVVVTATGSADNLMMTDTTSTNLPTRISPAFWVSAKAENSLIYGNSQHPNLITQWNDCRGTPAQGYHFATNTMSAGFKIDDTTYAPYLRGDTLGNKLVNMRKTTTTVTNPGDSPALVWDTPITGIKAVFAVVAGAYDGQNGGGSLLGSTERLSTCHFYRSAVGTWYNNRFDSSNPDLWNAPYYINGHLPPDGQTLNGAVRTKPMLNGCFSQVVDVHPLGDGAEADCWGYQRKAPNVYGAWIGECIIYTNAVTEIERRRIENYLMAKWFGTSVIASEIVPEDQSLSGDSVGGANLNVAAGDAVSFESFTNAAGLVKSGDGLVYIKGLQTAGPLSVKDGVVNIQSYDVTTNFVLPAGALIHVDANDDDSFPNATTVEDGQSVPKWIDTDNPDNPLAFQISNNNYGRPLRRTDESSFVRPMKVVDYGNFHNDKDEDWPINQSGWYGEEPQRVAHVLKNGNVTGVTNATVSAVFAVWGTAAGGNQLVGGYHQQGNGFERDYTNSTLVAENIAMPILAKKDNYSQRQSRNAAISFESLSFKNGNEIILTETPPSGTYDVVSILSPYTMGCSSLGFYGTGKKSGGLQMGELILYATPITTDEARRIDAYLNYKWFGREPDALCRPAHVGALDVTEGATVNIDGNAPIVCSGLSGAGTVNGDVKIAGGSVFEVVVNQDGSITSGPSVTGAVDMSNGGVVRLTGKTNALAVGEYLLVSSSSVNLGGAWTVGGYDGKKRVALHRRGDGLWLTVSTAGLLIMVR